MSSVRRAGPRWLVGTSWVFWTWVVGMIFLAGIASTCAAAEMPPGTRKMSEILKRWEVEFGPMNPYGSEASVTKLRANLESVSDPNQRKAIQFKLANELLNLGRPEETLQVLTNLVADFAKSTAAVRPRDRHQLAVLEGLAYLRLGELENCIEHHNPDSCLLPIRGAGQHEQRRGSTQAEQVFLRLAQQRPDDIGARWLLNVAAMTLGHYPGGVPRNLQIPESVFESEASLPRFPEIAAPIGIKFDGLAGGVIAEDFDRDGRIDLMLSDWRALAQCQLFRNLGNGRFENITEKALLTGVTGGLNIMQTDYNNDGWPDVFIVRGAWLAELGLMPNSLLKNNGDGTFADVTEEAGLLSLHPALSAVWFDANNDGWLDLFVGNESQENGTQHPCELYLNNGNGTFTESAAKAGVAIKAFVRGVSAGDFNNDGWADLYVSCLGRTNFLFRNLGTGAAVASGPAGVRFTETTALAGVGEPLLSFPTWFWDYDNDGWLDLWVSGYGADARAFFDSNVGHFTVSEIVSKKLGKPSTAETLRLYRNRKDGTFANVTAEAKLERPLLTMGANFGDIDTDGFLDFYSGTGTPYYGSLLPNEMYRNDQGRRFQDVTTAGGFGHLQKGHGVAFADLNEDGHQEVIANMGGAFVGDNFFDAVFANPGNSNHWLKLKLEGRKTNRAAIGARIKVVASSGGGSPREIHRVVCSGGSFGASPLRQEIGLGQAERIDRVEVWWPVSRTTNTFRGLQSNHSYHLAEGETEAKMLPSKPFAFPLK